MKKEQISKEQIIKAASKVINKKGLENATIDDVAKEASIAKGSIYVYFKSKDELLTEAVIFLAEEKVNTLKKALSLEKDANKKLKLVLLANEFYAKSSSESLLMNYALLLSSHKNIRSKTAIESFKTYHKFIKEIINEGIKNKQFRNLNPEVLALVVILVPDLIHILYGKNLTSENLLDYKNTIISLINLKK